MNAKGAQILQRVEMWCSREYIQAREDAFKALAAGETRKYRGLRHDQEYWRRAVVVVNWLLSSGESADGQHT